MKASVRIADVHDSILQETEKRLVIVTRRTSFIGALFFKKEQWQRVGKVHNRVDVDGSALEVMLTAYRLLKENSMTAKDNKTLLTMLHWQFMNGLSDEYISSYGVKDDTEFLATLN